MSGVGKKLGSGVKTDCEQLLDAFVKTENVRYEDFVNIWKRMNFSFIYFGLKNQVDQRDFTEEAFQVATTFLMSPYTFQVRIGALYLLYGLYFTQIQDPKIKIRIALNNWQELIALYEDIQKQRHLDAEYVYLRLKFDKAFMVTATSKPMFYHRRLGLKTQENTAAHMHQPHSILAESIDSESLEYLEMVHNKYQNLKTTIKNADNPSLQIVKDSMSSYINRNIQDFLERQAENNRKASHNNQDVSDDEEKAEVVAAHERALRIAKIKQKSFCGSISSPHHHASRVDNAASTSTQYSTSSATVQSQPDSPTDEITGENSKEKLVLNYKIPETGKKRGRPKKAKEKTGKKKGKKRKNDDI
ncbi:snRNA-activating protein complex subunit 1-like [Antedon mediterranea]|uniref:snRNA-activating protein complex subunit 1-like n=1 Tax=Antedon mediterranea TaxID=105859 RepID=UPI003AF608E5